MFYYFGFVVIFLRGTLILKHFFPFAVTASQPPQRPWIPLSHPERNKPIGKKQPFQPVSLRGSHIQMDLSVRIVILLMKKNIQTLVLLLTSTVT